MSAARDLAAAHVANLYVLALEESCPWWMDKGFVLEERDTLNARLNVFPDVHLLRLVGDPEDVGSAEDLQLREKEEEEEEDQPRGGGGGEAAGGGGDGDGDEEAELQAALALSLAPSAEEPLRGGAKEGERCEQHQQQSAAPAGGADEEEDAEAAAALQEAIALSLQSEG